MYQNQSTVNKLQFLSSNQVDDPKVFGLVLYDFMAEYDKNINLSHINTSMVEQAKRDTQRLQDLMETAAYEMELAYYEFRCFQIKKYDKDSRPLFNDIFSFEMYRDDKMAIIGDPMIARYRILRDFVESLTNDCSDEAKALLKKSADMNDEGNIQELIFAPTFYLWQDETKQLEGIRQTRVWYSWDQLASFYLNYHEAKDSLKKEDIPGFRLHMNRILQYTEEHQQGASVIPEAAKYTISYEPEKGNLTVNEEPTNFKKNSASRVVLKMLIPNKGFIRKKIITYEAAYTQIMKIWDRSKKEPNIYEICRSINKNVAKLGYPDFLLFPDDTIQINPKYLR